MDALDNTAYVPEPEETQTQRSKIDNLLCYWQLQESINPDLAKMAFNMHSIPAMSAECDRVFSSTKLLITDLRARMGDDIMEASECLKAWDKVVFCMYCH